MGKAVRDDGRRRGRGKPDEGESSVISFFLQQCNFLFRSCLCEFTRVGSGSTSNSKTLKRQVKTNNGTVNNLALVKVKWHSLLFKPVDNLFKVILDGITIV